MTTSPLPRVLCVDDEPMVLESLKRHLRKEFVTHTATSGPEALALVRGEEPFMVVVSDMRMPGMNGAEFLARMREIAPQTVRILFTGQSDMDSAIAAVNEGQVFRFIMKPSPAARLIQALQSGVDQYRLITAERELLEKTLLGSLRTLTDVLSLSNPEAFGRASRVKRYVSQLAARYGVEQRWQVESAAMLSQIGTITLPAETVAKVNRGRMLTAEERVLVDRVPEVNESLLANIPRLERVRAILALATGAADKPGRPTAEPGSATAFAGELLRLALDYDALDGRGMSHDETFQTLRARSGRYDPKVLEDFAAMRAEEQDHDGVQELPLSAVRPGMVLADDVRMTSGMLLAPRGYVVTSTFVERAINAQSGTVVGPIRCLSPQTADLGT
jgi:response regulator RpfG family c-di-GMP phosphodiesterase